MKLNKGFIMIEVLVSLIIVGISIQQIYSINKHEIVIKQISKKLR